MIILTIQLSIINRRKVSGETIVKTTSTEHKKESQGLEISSLEQKTKVSMVENDRSSKNGERTRRFYKWVEELKTGFRSENENW